jgi:peptidyl-prolyl cis-trans isomerase SurA
MRLIIPTVLVLFVATNAVAVEPDARVPKGYTLLDGVVAVVEDDVVTLFELNRAFAPLIGLGLSIVNENERKKWFKEKRREVLDEQINLRLIKMEAKKLPLTIPPGRISAFIRREKAQLGADDEAYMKRVRIRGFDTLESYREHIENEMIRQQMVRFKVRGHTDPSNEDVKRVFMRDYYGGKKMDSIRVQHILIRYPKQTTKTQLREIQKRADQVLIRVLSEEQTFAELARQHSEDPGTKGDGGYIGWIERHMEGADPNFLKAAFDLKVGQISGIVQSAHGYHIIRVVDRKTVPIEGIDSIKAYIRNSLSVANFIKGYTRWIRELRRKYHVEERL